MREYTPEAAPSLVPADLMSPLAADYGFFCWNLSSGQLAARELSR